MRRQCIHGDECRACQYERYKKEDPIKVAYQTLKYNAKRRKKYFDLTLDEFRKFCIKTNYINIRGIEANSYHIDRIDESKGYTKDNIQILSNSDNVRKYRKFVDRDVDGKLIFTTIKIEPTKTYDDVPF